jgi:hypothetical protein
MIGFREIADEKSLQVWRSPHIKPHLIGYLRWEDGDYRIFIDDDERELSLFEMELIVQKLKEVRMKELANTPERKERYAREALEKNQTDNKV